MLNYQRVTSVSIFVGGTPCNKHVASCNKHLTVKPCQAKRLRPARWKQSTAFHGELIHIHISSMSHNICIFTNIYAYLSIFIHTYPVCIILYIQHLEVSNPWYPHDLRLVNPESPAGASASAQDQSRPPSVPSLPLGNPRGFLVSYHVPQRSPIKW